MEVNTRQTPPRLPVGPRILFALGLLFVASLLAVSGGTDEAALAGPTDAPSATGAAALAAPPTGLDYTGNIYYPESGHTLRGGFLQYWLDHGQATALGYPLTEEVQEDGLTVQYFERIRLEYSPKAGAGSLRLSNVGTLLTAERTFPQVKAFKSSQDRLYVVDTGHSLGGGFYNYYKQNNGATAFGNPISEEFAENGHTVQYFQRARFELVGGKVQLGKLGSELMATRLDKKYNSVAKRPQWAMNFNGLASNFPGNWSRIISLNQSWGNLPRPYKGYGLYAAMPADLHLYGRWGKVSKDGKSIWVQFIDVVAYKDISFFRSRGRVIDLGTESFQQFAPLKAGIIRVDVNVAWPGEGPDK